ncbi:MAG: CinA family nicotinamide mononucleotide deamidase-related protein [Anaerolineae bacterium]|nr:CinA family nicotinamide mononucleotide deamidase-related protein [Anaerolineae bacterium]
MTQQVNAEIVAIGTEILLGEITDTNSVHIARVLRDMGINLFFMTSVGDNEQRIADAIRIAMSRADVVITCGGLGPTVDDMTRQAVALATERGLTFHQTLLDKIAERFASFKVQMTENNKRQAYLPDNAILVENPVGTAPSFIVEYQGRSVISLPGVPREMKFLLSEQIVPYLRTRFDLANEIIKAKVLKTAGIGESMLDAQIGEDLLQGSNPTIGLAAHAGQVDIRITAKAANEQTADAMIDVVEKRVRERVGKYIFGSDDDRIEDVLAALLIANNGTVAISETGIGEPISQRVLKANGATGLLQRSEVYQHPDDLRGSLELAPNTSIRDVAECAAKRLCEQVNATAAIAVVSYPDQSADHADSDAGSAIAVFTPGATRSRVYGFGGQSDVASTWVSTWSLSMLWQILRDKWEQT